MTAMYIYELTDTVSTVCPTFWPLGRFGPHRYFGLMVEIPCCVPQFCKFKHFKGMGFGKYVNSELLLPLKEKESKVSASSSYLKGSTKFG